MKRIVGLALVLLMLAAACVGAAAETTTAQGNGFLDVPFANGYHGFCIDVNLTCAYIGDSFSVANDTSVATSNKTGEDISQKLKLLFTLCFEDIFEFDDENGYVIPSDIADSALGLAVYHFAGDQDYVWGTLEDLVEKTNAYTGGPIPDHGYKKTLENGDSITFDFAAFEPMKDGQQTFFAYKISLETGENTYNVTIEPSENGSVITTPASGEKDTPVTLTITPAEGYELDELKVNDGDVTVSQNENGTYTFKMPDEDVTVEATFKLIEDTVPYTVTVTTDGNGTASANPASGATGTEVTLNAAPNSGYQFKEWEGVSDNVTVVDNKFTIGTENVVIKAIFEKIPEELHIVTFDANGGSGEMADQTFDGGVKQPLRKNTFIRGGYTFTGWNTKADGTGTAYADEQSVTVAANVTLYAIWEKDASLLRITRQPQDQFVTEGQKAEFAVEAEGDGLTYQWYIDRGDGKGLVELKGAEDASYVTSTVELGNDGYVYVCKVTDEKDHTVTSEAAVLHVSEMPVLPQTGDSSAPALYLALGMLSVLGLAVLGRKSCIR